MRPERAAPIDDRAARLAEVLTRFNLPAMLAYYGVPGAEHAGALQDLQCAVWMHANDLPADDHGRRAMLLDIAERVARGCRRRAALAAARFEPLTTIEAADPCDVHARIDARAKLAAVRDALARLPPQQRAAIIAIGLDGLPAKEIAERLGVTENAVNILLWRARAQLRAAIQELLPEDDRDARAMSLAPYCLGDLLPEHRAILRAVLRAEGNNPPLAGPPGTPPGPPRSRLPRLGRPAALVAPKLAPWLAAGAGIVAAAVVLCAPLWPRPRPEHARGFAGLFALIMVRIELPPTSASSLPGRSVAVPLGTSTPSSTARTSGQAGRVLASASTARGAPQPPGSATPPIALPVVLPP